MQHPIPLFYRIFFLYLDPLICASGTYLALFVPQTFVLNAAPSFLHSSLPAISSASASSSSSLDRLSSYLVHSLGAWSLSILSLQLLLLHSYPRDVRLWKIFQFSVLLIDLELVYGIYVAAESAQVAYGMAEWTAGDWTNNGIMALVITVRTAFLVGIGGVGRRQ